MSAAHALNTGAREADGEWLLFAHQDVVLLADDWLAKAEPHLRGLSDCGWVGVIGVASDGTVRGLIRDRAALAGRPSSGVTEVQTLDECVLLHLRLPNGEPYFDPQLEGWHAYGVEACCRALRERRRNYVLPLPIWHDSASVNLTGLREAQAWVWAKHGDTFSTIFTACGALPDALGRPNFGRSLWARARRRARSLLWRARGFGGGEAVWLHEVLDQLTRDDRLVECLHVEVPELPQISCEAFAARASGVRPIMHSFRGLRCREEHASTVVVACDLGNVLMAGGWLFDWGVFGYVRRVIVCVDAAGRHVEGGRTWRQLYGLASQRILATPRVGIFELVHNAF